MARDSFTTRISAMLVSVLVVVVAVLHFSLSLADKAAKTNLTPIEHVVVLMLENRSFDHMLGMLKQSDPRVEGCLPTDSACSNPVDPADPSSPRVAVDDQAVYVQTSPSHSIAGTTVQLYGSSAADTTRPAPMSGFVKSYTGVTGSQAGGETVMRSFSADHLPVLFSLAQEYALFDGWHASIPGPTMPNRAYAASATSHGMGENDEKTIAKGLPQKTLFRQLEEMGLDYRVYFELVPAVMMMKDLRHKDARPRFHSMKKFYTDVAAADLPQFTWLEPRYYNTPGAPADDQHPDHDVAEGETLIKNVYEALRESALWNSTALIVTYDEHGGFFDHVSPSPSIPSPDDINFVDSEGRVLFDFTRLGVRIPTVIASPWVQKGTVVHGHAQGEGQFEHSSLAATVVHKLFRPVAGRPKQAFLTQRDAWAATFESVFTRLPAPREDCLKTLPRAVSQRVREGSAADLLAPRNGTGIVNDLQLELLSVVAGVAEDSLFRVDDAKRWTEIQAATYARDKLNAYFGRDIVEI